MPTNAVCASRDLLFAAIVEPVKDDASTPPNSDPVSDPTTSLAVKDSSEDVADCMFHGVIPEAGQG